MKKSLVLAMALAMGVTASAYAANPFSDVPAGHWAYDAVDKLAAAGVIDGMGDGTFQGDKTMTRYEMAQIVAKAMAKGANVEKLAAEFADELDQLGVRVAKLEKKSDNVTITGQIRYEAWGHGGDRDNVSGTHRLRTRLFLNGQINEDWAYHARIQNDQNIKTATGDNSLELNQAWLTGKLFGLKVAAGRQGINLIDGYMWDDTMDAVKVEYGKNVKFTAYAGQATERATAGVAETWKKTTAHPAGEWVAAVPDSQLKVYGAKVDAKIGAVNVRVGYNQFDAENAYLAGNKDWSDSNKVWDLGVNGNIGKLYLGANYMHASNDVKYLGEDPSKQGFAIDVKYGAAKDAQAGSWDVWAKYFNLGAGIALDWTLQDDSAHKSFYYEGLKGYGVGADYVVAKNILARVDYYDLKGKESDLSDKVLMGRLQFSF